MGFLGLFTGLFVSQATFAVSEDTVILDVRTPQEVSSSHVPNSKNIDFYSDTFKDDISKLDKTKSYGVYCRSGNRSGQTVNLMKSLGFEKVENLGSVEAAAKKLDVQCVGC